MFSEHGQWTEVFTHGLDSVPDSVPSIIPGASSSCGGEALLANLTATVFRFAPVERVRFEILGHCDLFYEWLQADCTVIER